MSKKVFALVLVFLTGTFLFFGSFTVADAKPKCIEKFKNWNFQTVKKDMPKGWKTDQFWPDTQRAKFTAIPGMISISANDRVDARLIHKTKVCQNTNYTLEGDLSTYNVSADRSLVENAGAHLRVLDCIGGDCFIATKGIVGTTDSWVHVKVKFNSGKLTVLRIGPSLGIYSGEASGLVRAKNIAFSLS